MNAVELEALLRYVALPPLTGTSSPAWLATTMTAHAGAEVTRRLI